MIARALLARIVATARAELAGLAFVAVVVAIAEFAELACFLITQTKPN